MRTVYEAMNSLEGSMIQQLLDARGILAHVSGGFLEGGAGDLQAGSVVRVMVDELDADEARAIIDDWESREVPAEGAGDSSAPRQLVILSAFIAGMAIGALSALLLLA